MQTRFVRTRYILACSSIKAMAQCQGTTRGGKRCSITSTSTLLDDHGRCVGAPLAFGTAFCSLHGRPFSTRPVRPDGQLLVFFLDFEATGVDPKFDRVVEFAAIACLGPPGATPPSFSTVICVDAPFLQEHGGKAGEIHRIPPEEIAQGPDFACAFGQFVSFVEGLVNTALESDTESDDDDDDDGQARAPRIAEEPPRVVIAAHNGERYDFTMLLCECERNGVLWQRMMAHWLFVDTLHIFDSIPMDLGGCRKLQCVSRFCSGADHGMQAHRALADTIVLRAVAEHISQFFSVSLSELMRPFCLQLDVDMTARYLNALAG